LSLVDNGLTIKGLMQCRDMVVQDNFTLAVLKLSQQDATQGRMLSMQRGGSVNKPDSVLCGWDPNRK
jgi:hypothetical protein